MHRHLHFACRVGAGTALVIAAIGAAHAQNSHPTRNVRMIVPFTPGGGADLHARTLGMALSTLWSLSLIHI